MTPRTGRTVAWIVMAALVVVSSYRTQVAIDRVKATQEASCTESNAARSVLRELAADLVSADGTIDDDDRNTLTLVARRLGPKECG